MPAWQLMGTGASGIERERTSRTEKEEDIDDEFK